MEIVANQLSNRGITTNNLCKYTKYVSAGSLAADNGKTTSRGSFFFTNEVPTLASIWLIIFEIH